RGDSRAYSLLNVAGTLLGSGILVAAVMYFDFVGAAYSIVFLPAMLGVVALGYMLVRRRELISASRPAFDNSRMKHLLSFSLVTLVGALSVPLAQLFIRDVLAKSFGWEQVGLWQGVVKLSDVYMQFIGVVLINFVLPRYSAAESMGAVLRELRSTVFALLGLLVCGFSVLYVLRDLIITLVFSEAFLPMSEYLVPQMLGDILRTVAAAISYVFLARGAVRVAFAFELSQGIFLALVFSLIAAWAGSMAPVYAHLITYFLLALAMAVGLFCWVKRKSS
ncbi:MAG: oligosaccharide flippase family protein, partial [Pseudomonas sp.]